MQINTREFSSRSRNSKYRNVVDKRPHVIADHYTHLWGTNNRVSLLCKTYSRSPRARTRVGGKVVVLIVTTHFSRDARDIVIRISQYDGVIFHERFIRLETRGMARAL